MGSTKVEAPEIKPIDIGASITQAASGYEAAAPAIIRTEKTLRPAMQKLALDDARTALLGGTPELRETRDAAQAALNVQTAAKSKAESEIKANIAEINKREFNVADQRAKWEADKADYKTHEKDTKNLIQISKDQEALKNFKRDYPSNSFSQEGKKIGRKEGEKLSKEERDAYGKALAASNSLKKVPEKTFKTLENYRKQQKTTGPADEQSRLGELVKNYEGAINTVTDELAGTDAEISAYKRESFEGETAMLVAAENDRITELAQSGNFEAADIERLQGELQTASDAVLAGSPGMLDLTEYAVRRQFELGEELKDAAAKNEFHTIQQLAPELVEMYREADPGSVDLAELASKKATMMVERPDMGQSEQQDAMRQLRADVGLAPAGGPLGGDVERATKELLGQGALGATPTTQQLGEQVSGLLQGPKQAGTESALIQAGRATPAGTAQAQELSQFGTDQLAATGRPASDVERALGTAAQTRLGAEQREAGLGETSIRTAAQDLLGREAGGPSLVQQDVQAQALRDIDAGVRGASTTEQALRQAAKTGLEATQRTEGEREKALTTEGLRLLEQQAGDPSGVQSAMADAAIRDMGAEARGASEIETALGASATRGMDAELRAASPEQAALQARINELIGGAGRLSDMEQRQVEQEMLALQQRQGRARDTGAAAAVTGRMAEERRADLGRDLGQASTLLGQQDALTQARIQEQMQARALGQQGAVGAAGLEATRQDEMLRQRGLGQQAGVSSEQMELARAQQIAAERQAGAGFLGEAESLQQARIQEDLQRQGIAQQAAAQTMGQETARQAELLQRQAQGVQAGTTAEQMDLARQQQQITATQAGAGLVSDAASLEQARFQELMAQQQAGAGMASTAGQLEAQRVAEMQAQQGMGAEALGQAAGLGLQGQQQQLVAMQSAAEQQAQRQTQRLQGVGLAQDIAGQQFQQEAAGRELAMRGLATGAGVAGDLAAQQFQQQGMLAGLLGQEQQAEAQRIQANIQREQAGLGSVGAAFGMSKAMSPDIGAYFGRSMDPSAGFQAAGMAQQQAMYGTTPQAADYGQGVNIAMAQQANQAGLDSAAMSASATKSAGQSAMIGSIAGGLMGCWVAREVYGNNNPMWILFREWMLNKAPSWFRNLYIKHGAKFAKFISNKPFIKKLIRKWMTSIVRKYYGYVR